MARLGFHVTMAVVLSTCVIAILARDLGSLRIHSPPEVRVLVDVYYDEAADRLSFRATTLDAARPRDLQLDAPEGTSVSPDGGSITIGPARWSATRSILLAIDGGPPGIRLATPPVAPQSSVGAGPSAPRSPVLVDVYYDGDADRLTFHAPVSNPSFPPAVQLSTPGDAQLDLTDDSVKVGKDSFSATRAVLSAIGGSLPGARIISAAINPGHHVLDEATHQAR